VPLQYTRGFLDHYMLLYKYDRHIRKGHEFPYANKEEYEENADRFLGGPRNSNTLQRYITAPDGTRKIVRFDQVTGEFGFLSADGFIETYYKADPAIHGFATNLDYFNHVCGL